MNRSQLESIAIISGIAALIALVLVAGVVICFDASAHQKVANTLGLALDIVGVIYIAHDIFPFSGIREITRHDMIDEETKEFVTFKQRHVIGGLIAITTGYFCQMFGYWAVEIETLLGLIHA